MRVLIVTFALLCALAAGAAAQQANSSNDEPKDKKTKNTESRQDAGKKAKPDGGKVRRANSGHGRTESGCSEARD